MKGFISAIDGLPLIVKILFCLPALDIIWAIYRIVKGVSEKNVFLIVIGIIWIIGACTITWLVDLITVIIGGKPILA